MTDDKTIYDEIYEMEKQASEDIKKDAERINALREKKEKETFESKLQFIYQLCATTEDAQHFRELKQLHDQSIEEKDKEIAELKAKFLYFNK